MSITTDFTARMPARTSLRAVARTALFRGAVGALRWWRIVSTRSSLTDLDARMLADLGISRAQANFELSRMPWNK